MSFFPDRHEEHRHQDPQRPFLSPAGFHGVGSNTRPREVAATFKKHRRRLGRQTNVIYLTNLLRNETFLTKTEKNISMFGALGGPNFLKKSKGFLRLCHVFLKVVPKHENGQLD